MIETEWETGAPRELVDCIRMPKAGKARLEVTNGSSAVHNSRDSLSMPADVLPTLALVEGGPLNTATVRSKPTIAQGTQATAQERACLAARVAADNKGRDVIVLDMRQVTPLYDYFVLATGNSR